MHNYQLKCYTNHCILRYHERTKYMMDDEPSTIRLGIRQMYTKSQLLLSSMLALSMYNREDN